eukprot:gene13927-10628_t
MSSAGSSSKFQTAQESSSNSEDEGATPYLPKPATCSRSFDFVGHPVLLSSTATQLQCPAAQLNQLHIVEAERGSTPRRNSKRFQGKKKDVQAFEDLGASSSSIPLDTIVFQRQPCLRVSPPKSGPIGRRHRDRDYGHQPGQINYWLPLASAAAENTLWVERVAHLEAVPEAEAEAAAAVPTQTTTEVLATPLSGDFGRCWEFYGNGAYHFTRPNTTSHTRVSLDFRIVPGPVFDNDWIGSRSYKNGKQAFFLGET